MEITCDIAMDLVDIYTSGVASGDTKAAVKEHLKTCRDCREFYDGYKKSLKTEHKPSQVKAEMSPGLSEELLSESMRKLSKRLRTRRIVRNVTSIAAVIVSIALFVRELTSDE